MHKIPIKQLLKKYNVRPSKKLGQNFLVAQRVLQKIIEAAELKPDDIVLEIGPGIGNLTTELAKRVKRVVAIEKDPKMVEILKNVLDEQSIKNVQIIQNDVLKIKNLKFNKNLKLKIKNFKLVANLPYYITSPVIRKFLENTGVQSLQMVLLVQKEVAQRIVAQPPKMSILAVSVQFYAKPEIIAYVSKKSFWPQPKVDSSIIKIIPKKFTEVGSPSILRRSDLRQLFFRIVKAGFSHPRKQLLNNLAEGLKLNKEEAGSWLLKNGVEPHQRAETLSIKDWLNLAKNYRIEK